jgi:hypothetical protein
MLMNELLAYLFDGQPHRLAGPMETWLASSRRFTAFVATARDKIRKKIRVTQDPETLRDLQLELETAYLLLQEQRLSLVYEPPNCGQDRCPDFAVTFTTSLTFMVEVTRVRGNQTSAFNERITDSICSKLGQLLRGQSNILIVGVDVALPTQSDFHGSILRVQQQAEHDALFWQRYRFRDRADFFNHFQRLSEVILRGSQLQSGGSIVQWVNPQGKYPLPSKVRTALTHSHTLEE